MCRIKVVVRILLPQRPGVPTARYRPVSQPVFGVSGGGGGIDDGREKKNDKIVRKGLSSTNADYAALLAVSYF